MAGEGKVALQVSGRRNRHLKAVEVEENVEARKRGSGGRFDIYLKYPLPRKT